VQTKHCQSALLVSQSGAVVVQAAAGLILIARVAATYGGNVLIYAIGGFFWFVQLGAWIAVTTQYQAVTGNPVIYATNCQVQALVKWSPLAWASSVAFDVVLLAFVFAKVPANAATRIKLDRLIFKDGLLFFIMLTSVHIMILALVLTDSSMQTVKSMIRPFTVTITYAMGTRIYLNLKAYVEKKDRVAQGLPVSQMSGMPSGQVFSSVAPTTSSHIRYGSPEEPKSFLPLDAPSISYRSSDETAESSRPFVSITKEVHIAR
jgi:hypothetical protein